MQTNVLAMVLAALVVGAVAGPVMAVAPATAGAGNTGLAVDVTQTDGVTVTLTDDGTGVGNASVEVATVDSSATYNETATTTTILEAGENFGPSVSAFVAVLGPSEMDGPPGHVIAPFVLSNNPGEVPDHAGPPDDESDGTGSGNDDRGDNGKSNGRN